ncbi:MAG: sigma-54-dependent transcriptional regulator [Phycisphaerae bacterium]
MRDEHRGSVVVVDDESSICLAFQRFFEKRGWRVDVASNGQKGLDMCRRLQPTVAFLDVRLPDISGLDLLEELEGGSTRVVVITAFGGLESVMKAIRGKAFDYLPKPIDLDAALAIATRIRDIAGTEIAQVPARKLGNSILIGRSLPMQDAYKLIARYAASESPVLIEGETGTGKELAARAIHHFGGRSEGPFVAVNCGAIPENLIESELFGHVRGAFTGATADRAGLFEVAAGGVLLLDEVGDLPLAVQVKLLRVLDDGMIARVGSSQNIRTNVRVLSATNRNLKADVEDRKFRQDLYYRLAVLRMFMPALRERPQDIPELAEHFLRAASGFPDISRRISDSALEVLQHYHWPGNVRELRSAMAHVATVSPSPVVLTEDLPLTIRSQCKPALDSQLGRIAVQAAMNVESTNVGRSAQITSEVERALIVDAMTRFRGNQSEAAEYLGLHRNTLRSKLREMNVNLSDFTG